MEIILLLVVAFAFLKNKNEDAVYQTSDETVVINGNAGTVVVDPKTGNTTIHAGISISKAKAISAALVIEMSKYFASELTILNLLKGLNDADYRLVYKEFGLQWIDPITNVIDDGWASDQQDLTMCLLREIQDTGNRARLKSQFPATF